MSNVIIIISSSNIRIGIDTDDQQRHFTELVLITNSTNYSISL